MRIVTAFLAAAVSAFGTPAAPPTVFVVDALTRVRPLDPPGTVADARIRAARNEYEAFQLVVRAGEGGLKNVTVAASDLTGPEGRSLPRRHVALFREHSLDVKTPSPKSRTGPGLTPDALLPLLETPPARAPRIVAFPFDLPPGTNQPLWIEVYVPPGCAPGEYAGTLTVSAQGEKPVSVPVALTVWNFTLPETPSLRTNFGGLGRRLAAAHRLKPDSPELRAVERRYAEAMAEHRICPPIPPYLRPRIAEDGTLDAKDTHAPLKEWMERFHVTGFPVTLTGADPAGKDRAANVRALKALHAYLKEHGWDRLAYCWVLDEPNDAKAYEEVRRRAALLREAAPGIKVLCTEQPAPSDPAWGTLVGSVDLWVPLWANFEEKSVAERRKAGDEVWSYTALCQGKKGEDTPFWQLDFPLLNYRIAGWMSRRHGLTGLLYWTMVFWPGTGDVWTNPLTYKEYNGEGMLFYPGADVGVDGPVTSLRLKALRDGLEDYEYLVLAGDAADEIVARIAPAWTRWESDGAKLAAAREELARRIVERK